MVGYKPIHRPVQPMIDQPKEENDTRRTHSNRKTDQHRRPIWRGEGRAHRKSSEAGGRFRHTGNAQSAPHARVDKSDVPARRRRKDFGKKVKTRLYSIQKGDQKYAGKIS